MAGGSWQAFETADLVWLADSLAKCGDVGKDARGRLADHLLENRLGTAEAARKAAPADWRSLAGYIAKDLDAVTQKVWAERLRAAFADPKKPSDDEIVRCDGPGGCSGSTGR